MKFNYIAHDNQSKSMKKLRPGKLSSFNWERKMDITGPVTFLQRLIS